MKKLFIFVLALCVSEFTYASNFNWKFSVDSISGKSIGDDVRNEIVDDWSCLIGEPKGDIAGNEIRRFGCGTKDSGLQAYLLVSCFRNKKTQKLYTENGCLNLQMKKSASKMACVFCE